MRTDDLLALSVPVGSAVFAGLGTYLLTRRDFRGRGTAPASIGCALLVGAASWFAFIFPLFTFLVAAAAYLVTRRLIRVGPALAVSAVALVCGLVLSEIVMINALNSMG
jgi:hypothetical protein